MQDPIHSYRDTFKVRLNSKFQIEDYILRNGCWDKVCTQIIELFVKEGDCCLDIGANAGFLTLPMAQSAGASGRVHAFEPCTLTHERLQENLRLNPSLADRVQVHKTALSDHQGQEFVFLAGGYGNAYVASEVNPEIDARPDNVGTPTPVATLDSILEGQRVDFIKIDVEGAELAVLKGAQRCLEQFQPIVLYEALLECFDHENLIETQDFLESLGYVIFSDNKDGKLVKTTYPHYSPDLLAIPRERIPEFANLLNGTATFALQYEVPNDKAITEALAGEITVVSIDRKTSWVIAKTPNGSQNIVSSLFEQSRLFFEIEASDTSETASYLFHFNAQEPENVCGTLAYRSQTIPVHAQKLSGNLKF